MTKLVLDVASLLCVIAGLVLAVETLARGGTIPDACLWIFGAVLCAGALQSDP